MYTAQASSKGIQQRVYCIQLKLFQEEQCIQLKRLQKEYSNVPAPKFFPREMSSKVSLRRNAYQKMPRHYLPKSF